MRPNSSVRPFHYWLLGTLALSSLTGCNEEEHKQQLAAVEKQAEKKIAEIKAESKSKVESLEKQIAILKTEAETAAASAKAEAEEAVNKAQASAEDSEKEAAKILDRARAAYKLEAKTRYQTLNKDLAEVTAKASKVPAKSKAAYDKALKAVVALQKDITKDIAAYDEATLDTFGKVKAKVDVDLAKYKAAIAAVQAKVPRG